MRLLFLTLIVTVFGGGLGSDRAQYCFSTRHCEDGEICVFPRFSFFFWSRWRRGVCKPKPCRTGSDCEPDECCESTVQLKGRKKRQIGGTDGVCKALKSKGGSCLIQYPAGKPASTVLQCPCTSDLTCIPDGGRIIPQGYTGLCGIPTKTRSCTSGSDCGPNECCESTAQLKGRKKRQIGGTDGVCKPLQSNGGSCLIQYPAGKPASTVLQCPCTADLTCIPDGGRIIPQGYTGLCGIPTKPRSCTSGSDCEPNECCESTAQLKGRKKRQIGGTDGVCKPLQSNGGSCLIQYPAGKPASTVLQCPCTADLTCIPDGGRIIPQGYTGLCGIPTKLRSCTSGSDCGPNECCESTAQLKGRKKRQIGGTDGVCKPLQSNGGSCLIQYPPGKPSTTVLQCPCTSDLTCAPDGGRIVPQGYTGVCSAPVSCSTGADCNSHECCKSRVRPIGRKRRQAGGVCEPMGTSGASCLTRYPPGKPDAMVFSCPCKSGLNCAGSGSFDIPLGETAYIAELSPAESGPPSSGVDYKR